MSKYDVLFDAPEETPAEIDFISQATGYHPVDPGDPEYQMEGGHVDREDQPVYTLDQYNRGEAPYVTVAMDAKALPYGTPLESPDFPGVPFQVRDTGSAFRGKGVSRVDIARDTNEGATAEENNRPVRFKVGGNKGKYDVLFSAPESKYAALFDVPDETPETYAAVQQQKAVAETPRILEKPVASPPPEQKLGLWARFTKWMDGSGFDDPARAKAINDLGEKIIADNPEAYTYAAEIMAGKRSPLVEPHEPVVNLPVPSKETLEAHPIAAGIVKGASETASSFTSPRSIETFIGLSLLPHSVQKAAALAFAGLGERELYHATRKITESVMEGDRMGVAEGTGGVVASLVPIGLAAHIVRPHKVTPEARANAVRELEAWVEQRKADVELQRQEAALREVNAGETATALAESLSTGAPPVEFRPASAELPPPVLEPRPEAPVEAPPKPVETPPVAEPVRPVVEPPVEPPVEAAPAKSVVEPRQLTASEINKALNRLDTESTKLTDQMIADGRGRELPTETFKKTDPLAQKIKENFERRSQLQNEIEARYGPNPPSRLPTGRGFGPREKKSLTGSVGSPTAEASVSLPEKAPDALQGRYGTGTSSSGSSAPPSQQLTPAAVREQGARIEQIVTEGVNQGRDRLEVENKAKAMVDAANATGATISWQRVREQAIGEKPTIKRGGGKTESMDAPEAAQVAAPRKPVIDDVREAVEALPEQQRAVVESIMAGKTQAEIAAELGIKPAQVSALYGNAKESLRKSMGPGAASAEEALVSYEERSFGKRFVEDKTIAPEIREATGNRFYEPIPNKVTAAEAVKIIDERGIDESIREIKDEGTSLSFAVRSTIGQTIIKKLNKQFKMLEKAGEIQDAELTLNKSVDLAEWQMEYGTRLGQGVQSFAMWSRLTPAGKLRSFKRSVDKARTRHKARHEKKVEEIKETVNTVNAETGTTVSKTEKTRKALRQAKPKKEREPYDKLVWGQYHNDAINALEAKLLPSGVKKLTPALREFTTRLIKTLREQIKIEPAKKGQGLTDEQVIREGVTNFERYRDVWETTQKYLKMRYEGNESVLARLDEFFGQTFKEPFSRKTIDRLIEKQLDADQINLSELVRKHYSVVEQTGKDLATKISEDLGLTPEGAKLVADAVDGQFAAMATKAKAKALAALVRTNPVLKKVKTDTQKIIEASNIGALTDETFYNAVGEKLGFPEYNKAVAAEIMRRAAKIESMPEDSFMQAFESLKLTDYMLRKGGIGTGEFAGSSWYASVLLNIGARSADFVSTTANNVLETFAQFASTRSIDELMATSRGMAEGARKAIPKARAILKEGDTTGTGQALDYMGAQRVLETIGPESGRIKHTIARVLKYSHRIMDATDVLNISTAAEGEMYRLTMMKLKEAKDPAPWVKIHEVLKTRDKVALEAARAQAEQEGLSKSGTGYEQSQFRRRVDEILEQQRPEETLEAGKLYGLDVALRGEMKGSLGAIGTGAQHIAKALPISRYTVFSFIKTLINLQNKGIDWSPLAIGRLYDWSLVNYGKEYSARLQREPLTPKERAVLKAKIITGSTLIGTITYAAMSNGDKEGDWFDITGPMNSLSPAERAVQRAAGVESYSIKVGNTRLRYNTGTLGPLFFPLAIAGAMRDQQRFKATEDNAFMQRAVSAIFGAAVSIKDMPAFSQLADLFRGLGNASSAESFYKNMTKIPLRSLSGFVPSVVKEVDSWFDPSVKRADNLWEQSLRDIPLAREAISNIELNRFGEPIRYAKTPTRRFVSPRQSDPVWKFMADNGFGLSDGKQIFVNGERMPRSHYTDFLKYTGPLIKERIKSQMNGFKTMDRDKAQNEINDIVEKATEQWKNARGFYGASVIPARQSPDRPLTARALSRELLKR